MLKAKTIALSTFGIWGIIICIFYLKETRTVMNSKEATIMVTEAPQAVLQPKEDLETKSKEEPKEDAEIDKMEADFKGEIILDEKLCLDTLEHKSGNVGLWECHGEGRNQYWHMTKDHLLRNDDVCIQAQGENENDNLAKLEKCDGNIKNQKWSPKGNFIVLLDTERCMDGADRNGIKIVPCNKDSATQKFKLSSAVKELGG